MIHFLPISKWSVKAPSENSPNIRGGGADAAGEAVWQNERYFEVVFGQTTDIGAAAAFLASERCSSKNLVVTTERQLPKHGSTTQCLWCAKSGNTISEAVDEHVVKMQHAHGKDDSEVFLVIAKHHVDRPGARQRRWHGAGDGLPGNSLQTCQANPEGVWNTSGHTSVMHNETLPRSPRGTCVATHVFLGGRAGCHTFSSPSM